MANAVRRSHFTKTKRSDSHDIADCEAAKDLAWATQFLKELSIEKPPPVLKTDSEGAYNLSQTAKFLRRSRHIEHRYHYLWQQVQNGSLTIKTIPGKDNPSDHLTKLVPMIAIRTWKDTWMGTSGKPGSEE